MIRSTAALISLHIVLLAAAAPAATPGQINYQGLLLDQQGAPITGNVNLVFTIFNAAQSGTALWTETHPSVAALNGVYDVVLGATTPITPAVVAGGSLYLQIAVNGETLVPRQRLVAVPYAIHAETAGSADTVGGLDAGYLTQIVQNVDFDGGAPPNDDPREGLADPDGDGRANFIDSDNDNDGLLDTAELNQGSDINLVTPTIADIQPEPVEASFTTTVTVTGTSFESGMAVSFGSQSPTPQNVTATSFQVAVGPQAAGTKTVTVTRTNGQSATTTFQFATNQPVITSFEPDFLIAGTGGTIKIHGSGFQPGIAVTFGSESPTPQNITPTSLQIAVSPHPVGVVDVTVYYPGPGGASDTKSFAFVDDSTSRIVFVTSTAYNGNLGGVLGANAKCAARAAAASLPGTWFAWIGDSTGDPASSFSHPSQPYYLVNGTLIAGSYTSLTDGSIDHVIDRDEFGNSHFDYVWTNVNPNGTAGTKSCLNWSSGSSAQLGLAGSTGDTGTNWTAAGSLACSDVRRLYCFQQ
jgi:hypothetical protein